MKHVKIDMKKLERLIRAKAQSAFEELNEHTSGTYEWLDCRRKWAVYVHVLNLINDPDTFDAYWDAYFGKED